MSLINEEQLNTLTAWENANQIAFPILENYLDSIMAKGYTSIIKTRSKLVTYLILKKNNPEIPITRYEEDQATFDAMTDKTDLVLGAYFDNQVPYSEGTIVLHGMDNVTEEDVNAFINSTIFTNDTIINYTGQPGVLEAQKQIFIAAQQ